MKLDIYKRITLADILLMMVLIAIGLYSGVSLHRNRGLRSVYIYKNGVKISEYAVSKDRIVRIDDHNTIEIKHGKVRMIHADCPDKRCIKQGYSLMIPIICLPNRLVIEIKQSENEKKLILY